MKCIHAEATFSLTEYFEESVQEMIDEGELSTEQEVKEYIKVCLMEDIGD